MARSLSTIRTETEKERPTRSSNGKRNRWNTEERWRKEEFRIAEIKNETRIQWNDKKWRDLLLNTRTETKKEKKKLENFLLHTFLSLAYRRNQFPGHNHHSHFGKLVFALIKKKKYKKKSQPSFLFSDLFSSFSPEKKNANPSAYSRTYRKCETGAVDNQRLLDRVQGRVDLIFERLELVQHVRLGVLVDNEYLYRGTGAGRKTSKYDWTKACERHVGSRKWKGEQEKKKGGGGRWDLSKADKTRLCVSSYACVIKCIRS